MTKKENVDNRVIVTRKELEDAVQNIKGAVTICFPMGLPEYDPVREDLEGTINLEGIFREV